MVGRTVVVENVDKDGRRVIHECKNCKIQMLEGNKIKVFCLPSDIERII